MNNITTVNLYHLKGNLIDGGIVNGTRHPISYSFALDKPPGYRMLVFPKVKQFKKMSCEKFINRVTLCLEGDDGKTVDFKDETITFTPIIIR